MSMLSKAAQIATVLVAMTGDLAYAIGPSFDCGKAATPLERFICSNPDLSRADLEFAQAYYALRWAVGQAFGPAGSQAPTQEAIDFHRRVARQCGINTAGILPPDAASLTTCLQRGYTEQRSAWLLRLTDEAREEALRPIESHVALQQDLRSLGFLPSTAATDTDGVYGAATRSAIQAWQRSHGWLETGILGNHAARVVTQDAHGSDILPGATPADRIAGDMRAKQMAWKAIGGDQAALSELRARANVSDPSGMYGLTVFETNQISENGGTPSIDLINEYIARRSPEYKRMLDSSAAMAQAHGYRLGGQSATAMHEVTGLLEAAVKLGDPAAKAALGKEYIVEAFRVAILLDTASRIGPPSPNWATDLNALRSNPTGIVLAQGLRLACAAGQTLISQAIDAGWADGYLALTLVFVPGTPAPLMLETGCQSSNPVRFQALIRRAADLGSAEALFTLREFALGRSDRGDADTWNRKLQDLADGGDREARSLAYIHLPSNQ